MELRREGAQRGGGGGGSQVEERSPSRNEGAVCVDRTKSEDGHVTVPEKTTV